jgi:hypothetical protein
MPSAYKCRKSANLSRIARMVYGAEPMRPYPVTMFPTYPSDPPAIPFKPSKAKGGKRRGR